MLWFVLNGHNHHCKNEQRLNEAAALYNDI